MTPEEPQTIFKIFFNNHPVFCMILSVVIVSTVYVFYMQIFQHEEVLKQTMDMCVSAQSFQTQPGNLTAYDFCKAWVYKE